MILDYYMLLILYPKLPGKIITTPPNLVGRT